MFREMRLSNQQLSKEDTIDIIKDATNASLAINGPDKYPYSVPISFVYDDGKIYFHGAVEGQKCDWIKNDPHVSMSVIDADDVQPDKFTTYYRSAIIYGDIKILDNPEEIQHAMELTIDKYSPGRMEGGQKFINSQKGKFNVYKLDIVHMTGKRYG